MAMSALSTRPLIQALSNETADAEVKQVWYADDSSAVGSLAGVKKWWDSHRPMDQTFGTRKFLTPVPGPKEKHRILPESIPVIRIRSHLCH